MQPLGWGELELPLLGLKQDWQGIPLKQTVGFSLARDPTHLWFITAPRKAQRIHPGAADGTFTPELWKYDVSELFLGDPSSGTYLEFNLATNGAWWAAKFSSPRKMNETQPDFQKQVKTFADTSSLSTPLAALSIPLDFLTKQISFGKHTLANITFIQNSPEQTFISAAPLPGDAPDFHQPSKFSQLTNVPLETIG
jgi:hypothetical protein